MLRFFGSGPEWTNSTVMFDGWCRKNWWVNLLYMHNFINTDSMVSDDLQWRFRDFNFIFLVSKSFVVLSSGCPILPDITLVDSAVT